MPLVIIILYTAYIFLQPVLYTKMLNDDVAKLFKNEEILLGQIYDKLSMVHPSKMPLAAPLKFSKQYKFYVKSRI